MRTNRVHKTLLWVLVNVSRAILSLTLMFSGLVKMIDPRGTEYKIKDYAVAFGMDDMFVLYMPLGLSILLALFEFNIGVSLLFGNNRRWVSRFILALFLVFTPFTLYLAFTNPVHDCG